MRHLKMLGLVAVGGLTAVAFLVAGSASADVLCKTRAFNPCPAGWDLKATDKVESSLQGSATLETTSNTVLDTCTEGTWKWELLGTGGPGMRVPYATIQRVHSKCTSSVSTIKLGSGEVEHIEGTENGTVFEKESEMTFVTSGVSCTYGTGSGTDLGVLEAGSVESVLNINAVLAKTSGSILCPTTIKWTGKWQITNPPGIWVLP